MIEAPSILNLRTRIDTAQICRDPATKILYFQIEDSILSRNGRGQHTPTPPPRPPPHQVLRCASLANNYRTPGVTISTTAPSMGLPNSYSMASSSVVSQQWKGPNDRGPMQTTVVRQAQTQTETRMSCLRQFLYCLLANEVKT